MERSKFKRGVGESAAPRYGINKNKKKIIVTLIALICLLAVAFCAVMLIKAELSYGESEDYYADLRESVFETADDVGQNEKTDRNFQSIGKDVVGWLTFPDTQIDYPVAQCDNNSYYCYHLPDGTYNAGGTVFMDFSKRSNLSCKNTVLYAHHMKNGSMFADLNLYKDSAFYEEHKTAFYYTEQDDYEIVIAYGFLMSSEDWRENQFVRDENTDELLNYARQNTTFDSGVEITANDKIMTFSTCSYEYNDANYMIIGKVEPLYE